MKGGSLLRSVFPFLTIILVPSSVRAIDAIDATLFIHNPDKITGPKRSIKITDRPFTSAKKYTLEKQGGDETTASANACKASKEKKETSNPDVRHFNLPDHSRQHMTAEKLKKLRA